MCVSGSSQLVRKLCVALMVFLFRESFKFLYSIFCIVSEFLYIFFYIHNTHRYKCLYARTGAKQRWILKTNKRFKHPLRIHLHFPITWNRKKWNIFPVRCSIKSDATRGRHDLHLTSISGFWLLWYFAFPRLMEISVSPLWSLFFFAQLFTDSIWNGTLN